MFDNLATGVASNLEPFGSKVDFRRGDLRDAPAVAAAMQGVSHVLHLGALGSVPRSVEDPATSNDVNVNGTLNVLVAARDAGAKRVVFSSSSSVYGANPEIPKRVGMLTDPVSPYAVTKQAAESYTRVFHRVYGLETVALRYFNVYGPRMDTHGKVHSYGRAVGYQHLDPVSGSESRRAASKTQQQQDRRQGNGHFLGKQGR